ncbi:MAG: BrnT family toxin [Pseudomonadota bacterium]
MEWDERKRLSNLQKHGLDFEAFERFDWDSAVFYPSEVVDSEVRERVLGFLDDQLVYAVFLDLGGTERLISLRLASRTERKFWSDER